MKANEIREKLAKAQEAVAKKENTLKKHEAKVEKIKAQIIAKGWDVEAGRYQKADTPEHHDCYWMFCDYDSALESVKNTIEAIEEKKAIVAKWEDKLAKAIEQEKIEDSFPEILKDYKCEKIRTTKTGRRFVFVSDLDNQPVEFLEKQ